MPWSPTPRSRRCYHRVISGIERGGQLRFLTLTSSNDSPANAQRSFRALYMRMRRRGLLTGYIKVPELSKNMKQHVHVLFRGKYIEQALISAWWEDIHHAKVVDIRAVPHSGRKRYLASYMAKYLSKENTYRYSWNWGWVWRGFVKDWTRLKSAFYKYYGSFNREISHRLVYYWSTWLKGTWQPDWELIEILLPVQPKRR